MLPLVADLDMAAAVGSVMGAVAGVVSTWASVTAWLRSGSPTVFADSGSNAAGGDMRNPSARDTGSGSGSPRVPGRGVSTLGGSNAAGGDMTDPSAHRSS
ncbi:hypothetical protein [Embleya scabrispora]|uniref:hypothetical protein n=1 Tax=Embleya scabrispora TaxID=159449 RepID=UPI00118145A2|nr:hypothetical protein [Embleya scabrispora]